MNHRIVLALILSIGLVACVELPPLPDTFITDVEANFEELNMTLSMREYFGDDMERREVVRGGVLSVIINNFKEGVRHTLADENGDRVIDEASDSCTTRSLADLPSRTGDGHGHLESSVDFFRFGSKFNETYIGLSRARGILCEHWHTHIKYDTTIRGVEVQMNYTVDWYFSAESWSAFGHDPSHDSAAFSHRLPVRAVVEGHRHASGAPPHPFRHVYEYVRFWPITPATSWFYPSLQLCTPPANQTQTENLPTFANQFSLVIERADASTNTISTITEYYDYEQHMVRYDQQLSDGRRSSTLDIFDPSHHEEAHNVRVWIREDDVGSGAVGASCSVVPLNGGQDAEAGGEMKTPAHFMRFGNDLNEQYMGRYTVRGILCDRWDALVNESVPLPHTNASAPAPYALLQYELEYYFAVPATGSPTTAARVPVAARTAGTSTIDGRTVRFDRMHSMTRYITGVEAAPKGTLLSPVFDGTPLAMLKCDIKPLCDARPEDEICKRGYFEWPKAGSVCEDDSEIWGVASFFVGIAVGILLLVTLYCVSKTCSAREGSVPKQSGGQYDQTQLGAAHDDDGIVGEATSGMAGVELTPRQPNTDHDASISMDTADVAAEDDSQPIRRPEPV